MVDKRFDISLMPEDQRRALIWTYNYLYGIVGSGWHTDDYHAMWDAVHALKYLTEPPTKEVVTVVKAVYAPNHPSEAPVDTIEEDL